MKLLKTTTRITLLLIIGTFLSCESDLVSADPMDDDTVGTPFSTSIIGYWKLNAYTSNNLPLEFCPDIEVFTESTYSYNESWGSNCENLTLDVAAEPYSFIGTQLTFLDANEVFVYEVIELTATTLKLQDTYTEDTVQYIDEYTYIRQ